MFNKPLSPSSLHLRSPFTKIPCTFIMATKSDHSTPPSYHSIPTSELPADSIQSKKPSVFSFPKMCCETPTLDKPDSVLSCICDLVSAPDFTPSSATEIVNACAAALPSTEFSDFLQTSNIEGHTALYWAIVNDKLEVLSMFAEFISEFSSNCRSDLRLACMTTNNQVLFAQLSLGHINAKDKLLRHTQLGCPLDEIQVHGGDTSKLDHNQLQFVASFRIRMFQKRLRITHHLKYEFVAGGRIWRLHFCVDDKWKWIVGFGLSSPSLPACPKATFSIEAHHRKKGELGQETLPQELRFTDSKFKETHIPNVTSEDKQKYLGKVAGTPFTSTTWQLGDWVMYDNPVYVDCEGTLHAKLEMRFMNK
ncbi:hypothetical protein DEU56DRAFT_981534 [Suillus clintonianus]|uniref:uncharacterized protein n=1 Tax=Suillus clintonianus TaxID=1904413 RepID=UPI001B8641DC|nr:uncharacterized protein DEU56DRAFT_981534 [Suillus clintonianus]KAG2133296.1 hypothetical protein DEU56DRAFT_981534 [Suillus clintonianus]